MGWKAIIYQDNQEQSKRKLYLKFIYFVFTFYSSTFILQEPCVI